MIVRDINLKKVKNVRDLVKQFYYSGGFTTKKIGNALKILEEMIKEDYFIFLTFPACLVATGTRGVIRDMLKEKIVDGVITTCGTIDHDLARDFKNYYHGSFDADDVELHKKGINRLGNIFIPNESYGIIIEEKIQKFFKDFKGKLGSREIAWKIGEKLSKNSILYWAWKNKIPFYVPAIYDGAVGWQIWRMKNRIEIDFSKDEDELADIFFGDGKIGGIVIGGGVAKHHLIWWAQFHNGLDAAIYITSAQEWDGSLSGARAKEAISWGKIKEKAKHVTIEGDATVILPLLISSIR
ncbi:MAG: deoxyhypusine synthase [Thermoplasmatales archaeon]|nr:deoxyhypusine synthase [Thermoplasmatales archaeon]